MGFEVKLVKSKKNRRCELTKKPILMGEQYTAVVLIDRLDIHINGFKYRGNYDFHVFHPSVSLEDIYTSLLGKDTFNHIVAPESRTFTAGSRVRLGDVSPKGRMRLDGIARVLQDVATDDALDGAPGEDAGWVVRRTTIEVEQWPMHREDLVLTTWCSGYGRRWAVRRTALVGAAGGRVETESLWISVDRSSGRPAPLSPTFFAVWGVGVTDTSVTARRRLPDRPDGASEAWPLRFSDFDGLAHVNNAAYWLPAEEHLAGRKDLVAPLRAEVEYREGVTRGEPVTIVSDHGDDGFLQWWVVGGQVRSAARVLCRRSQLTR